MSELGYPELALENFRSSIQLNPTQFLVHYKIGVLLHNMGQIPLAVESYSAAI